MNRRQSPPAELVASATVPAPLTTGEWLRVGTANLARALVAMVLAMAGWSALPAVLGWQPTTVMSDSMQPRIATGDVIASMPVKPQALRPEQILLVDDPDKPGKLRLHRLVRITDDGQLILKGDANPQEDSTPVGFAAVHGVAALRVPAVGTPIVWFFTRQYPPLLLLVAFGLLLAGATTLDRKVVARLRPPTDGPRSDSGSGSGSDSDTVVPLRRRAAYAPAARVASAAVALLSVVGALAVPASAAATAQTSNPANTLAAASYFSCESAIDASNPDVYYRLNEATGTSTVTDSSGNGTTGAYQGTRTHRVTGACGTDSPNYAVTLNGSSGYVVGPATAVAAPNVFSFGMWFKTTTTRGGKLIGFGSSRTGLSTSFDRHVYMLNNGRLSFGTMTGSTKRYATTTSAYNDGDWHHMAATMSSAGLRLYVDGELVASNAAGTSGASYSAYLRIGFDEINGWTNAPTSDYFAGTIDEVTVHLSALSASAIKDQYEAGTP